MRNFLQEDDERERSEAHTPGWMWIRMGIGFIVSYPTPILLSNHTALLSYSSSVKRQIPDGEIRHCLQVVGFTFEAISTFTMPIRL